MATYTCITCRVAFRDAEMQRAHYKTDWHRYNLKRKVADMAPVSAEGFQERVRAQRAVAEQESKGTATYCTVCGKKFASFNAYENHLKSRRHLELEKKAVQAVNRKVEIMNEKNLEKGLGVDSVNKDAMNAAIQQAIRAQPSPKKAPPAPEEEPRGPVALADGGRATQDRDPAEKPPRLQWFEQQTKKLAKLQAEESEEDDLDGDVQRGLGKKQDSFQECTVCRKRKMKDFLSYTRLVSDWEDIDSDAELECEDAEVMDEVDEQDAEEREAGGSPRLGAIPVMDCLFCPHHSSSLMKNVAHMTKVHSFFIPDIEYLSDLKGLIKYLGEKVGVGKICLWCNEKGKSFYSTEAVQAHMNDKSHCKLFTDGDAALEFADFYDFRSSYPDYKKGEEPEATEDLLSEKTLEYDDETMELILPSGARVGHRSLMRYYKQRFGLSRAVTVAKNQKAVGRILQQYRALGWTGSTGAALLRERDMQYVQRMKSKWMLKTGMKNNATRQMHFRVQVRF
ncbi:cytoplasmic 60S subunit biogenesis factor ZNF622 isoform X1 [Manis pentadactyla]|uniref:cytoplasmic 60S subunit biogenesis factor ZNF622 isoform X1 n=1 Tax=Manis pentadactyla TaxID=143292 RepID=UPI00255C5125|nr:cytoplasmic 60S subunit biogenesis factor ZNF622 isoform X1 [Manis pentadactyla]